MTEKQISEEDLIVREVIKACARQPCEMPDTAAIGLIAKFTIQALHARGWRRREDVLEEAAVVADNREFYPGHKIAEDIRSLKDTP